MPVPAVADTTVEAEDMRLASGKVVPDRRASGDRAVALRLRGRLLQRLVTTKATSRLALRARLNSCATGQGSVAVALAVDGKRVMRRTIEGKRWRTYAVTARIPAGRHAIRLTMVRAQVPGSCSRPLRVDRITLARNAPARRVRPTPVGGPSPASPVPQPVAVVQPPAAREPAAPPLFVGDFETGDLSQWDAIHRQTADRIRLVRSPVRQGRYAARHEVREGDFVTNGERAEVLWGSTAEPTLLEGDEHYIGWSTYFPADFAQAPFEAGQQMFLQTHPQGPGSPAIEMRCDGGMISLDILEEFPWRTPLVPGVWHDFVLRAKWSADPAVGLVELWHNGRKVLSNYRGQTLEKVGVQSYLKMGYYRPGNRIQPTRFLYQDAVRVGTSYEAVAPDLNP